jgi:galactonate dehydratase
MRRREFLSGLLAYNAFLLEARAQGTSRAPKLTIREVRAVSLRAGKSKFVRVYTDQGLTGTGEMVDTIGADLIINKHVGPGLVGRDPLDIEGIYFDEWGWKAPPGGMNPVFMRGMGGPYLTAISGIDVALWDLAGKALGVPVSRLFGGRLRDKVMVYHHASDPGQVKELLQTTGVRAIKMSVDDTTASDNAEKGWDPGKTFTWSVNNAQIDDIVSHVGAMREAVGKDIGLALECHGRYDTQSAIQIARAVEPFRPMFLEEPIPSDNVEAMVKIRNSTPIPIAAGENIYTRYGYRPYLEKQALSLIQMDMLKCGGLLESRKIAAMAEVYHIPIAPHGVASSLGKTAIAHVCSTVPNFLVLEWSYGRLANLTTQPRFKAGFLELPEAPGIGIELNPDALKAALAPGDTML